MILKIAWRNVWRSRVRSTVVAIAIALGLWAGLFSSAFVEGVMEERMKSVIELEVSHLQFHNPSFRDELAVDEVLPRKDEILQALAADSMVDRLATRVVVNGMIASPTQTGGLRINGIEPEQEQAITVIHDRLVEGSYFEDVKRNPILISKKVAEKYRLKLRSKAVLTLQDVNGEIIAAAFRVVGIYDSGNGMFDQGNVYVRASDLQRLIGLGDDVHEVAVLLHESGQADPVAERYDASFEEVEVRSWLDLSVGMRYMVEAMNTYTYVIVGIILFALLFSIVNTMLMAVLERTRELGMLMAVGLNKMKVFRMIMLETIFLSMVGGPFGLLISYLSIFYFSEKGIDLGAAGETYSDMGFASVVYPSLSNETYLNVTLMVIMMAVLAAIYPAIRALKLNPSEAIRKI
jgi:ABC-type lipoprotein release transport system permease subunit